MRILGLDPAHRKIGWAILDTSHRNKRGAPELIEYGLFEPQYPKLYQLVPDYLAVSIFFHMQTYKYDIEMVFVESAFKAEYSSFIYRGSSIAKKIGYEAALRSMGKIGRNVGISQRMVGICLGVFAEIITLENSALKNIVEVHPSEWKGNLKKGDTKSQVLAFYPELADARLPGKTKRGRKLTDDVYDAIGIGLYGANLGRK